VDRYEFNRQLAETARAMVEEPETEVTLDRVVLNATELVKNADLAGLSLFTREGVETPAASQEDLRRIDRLQHDLREGPCIDALRDTDVVRAGNVATESRWPRWGPQIADEFDIRSSLSFRLFSDGHKLAALTLYARKPDSFTEEDLVDGYAVAAQAAVTLAATSEQDQLHHALHSRKVIGEAVGMLRERFGMPSDRAFEVLKRLSSQQNTKLFKVAEHIVDTGNLPDLSRASNDDDPTSKVSSV
jgi:GAF domain-containing protein